MAWERRFNTDQFRPRMDGMALIEAMCGADRAYLGLMAINSAQQSLLTGQPAAVADNPELLRKTAIEEYAKAIKLSEMVALRHYTREEILARIAQDPRIKLELQKDKYKGQQFLKTTVQRFEDIYPLLYDKLKEILNASAEGPEDDIRECDAYRDRATKRLELLK